MILETRWGIKTDCPHCGAKRHDVRYQIQISYLWANAHGEEIRIFCHVCGWWSDVKGNKNGVTVEKEWPPLDERQGRGRGRCLLNLK
jgi:hypothetical protein